MREMGKAMMGTGEASGDKRALSAAEAAISNPLIDETSMKGAKGVISYKVLPNTNGCGDEGGHVFSVKGNMQVTKATGALAKAKGVLRFTGTYSRDDGTFSVKLTGTLKK